MTETMEVSLKNWLGSVEYFTYFKVIGIRYGFAPSEGSPTQLSNVRRLTLMLEEGVSIYFDSLYAIRIKRHDYETQYESALDNNTIVGKYLVKVTPSSSIVTNCESFHLDFSNKTKQQDLSLKILDCEQVTLTWEELPDVKLPDDSGVVDPAVC